MLFSRTELDLVSQGLSDHDFKDVFETLTEGFHSDQNLTRSELNFVCNSLSVLRREDNDVRLDLHDYEKCSDCLFQRLVLFYFDDLDGALPKANYDGPVSDQQKIKDINFLNNAYLSWKPKMQKFNHNEELLNQVASETNKHLRDITAYCQKMNIGGHRKDYLLKSMILHSKLIYHYVFDFFDEIRDKELIIQSSTDKIVFNSYVFVHTLFRHFAGAIKDHQTDKDYFIDKNIPFKEIPELLHNITIQYLSHFSKLQSKVLYFRMNTNLYAMWFENKTIFRKGKHPENILRSQTFYPISSKNDLSKISRLKECSVNTNISFFVL